MKKLFGISLVVMFILAFMVVPALGQELRFIDIVETPDCAELECTCFSHDFLLEGAVIYDVDLYDTNYTRWDLIEKNAFQNVHGITTVNLASGNGNLLNADIDVTALAKANSMDLTLSLAGIIDVDSNDHCYTRWDVITDKAFQNAIGITTVQMSSGNANILQTSVGIEVSPAVAASIHN